MDASSSKVLESVAHRTLHAHNFTRSSSTASHVLTDLLSRYFSLLATTCSQYTQHAGRSGLTFGDAVQALDEMGVSMDDLTDFYESEGRELRRYAIQTTRRAEELVELKASLFDGLQQDRDDTVALIWKRVPTPPPLQNEDEEMMSVESDGDDDFDLVRAQEEGVVGKMLHPSPVAGRSFTNPLTPPLPPSPVSNASPPPRKRPRTASWKPPPHIPDFLPPFPNSSPPESPLREHSFEPVTPQRIQPEKAPTPPPQLSSSASTSDYLTPVPYSMSSISSAPERHLPKPPSPSLLSEQLPSHHPTPQITPSLLKAYHHVLTNKPPPNAPINPARHKVAMSLLSQEYSKPRWAPADTLFSTPIPGPPRVVAPTPSYPIPLKDPSLNVQDANKPDKDKEKSAPPTSLIPRTVVVTESITPLGNQPASRIPDIARHVLAPSVFTRVTKMAPPQPLIRGASEKLLYGPGIPAPWNSTASNPAPGPSNAKSKELPNGKSKGKEADQQADTLSDALLFATWEYEPKDFRVPLTVGKKSRPAPPVWTVSGVGHVNHVLDRRKNEKHERKS